MAVTVPGWADTLLDLIGVAWPNVDEDAYRDMADALREFAEDLEDDGQLANNHFERLLSSGQGEAMDALDEHWAKIKTKHIKDIAGAARTVATALDTAAAAIEAMKLAALVQLGYLASEAGIAISLIPVTGGLSALIGAGAMRATQEVIKRLIKECVEEAVGYVVAALTEPAVAALEGMAADLVVQLGAVAIGLQDGVDLDRTKEAGTEGFKGGVESGKESLNLASAGGGGGGSKGSGLKNLHIEHQEHDHASTQLNSVSVGIHGKTAGKLTKAKTAHGRTRGRDSIADAIDPVADKALAALTKAAKNMGDHVGKTLPKVVKQISVDHKNTDDDLRDRFARQRKGDGDDQRKGNGPGKDGRGPTRSDGPLRSRPEPLRDAKDDPRRNSVPLDKKTCKNDPVDVATGVMTLPQTDLSLPGTLPLALERTHLSDYRYGQWFGRSWASTLDERIEPDPVGGGAVWAREDGSLLVYPRLPQPDGEPVLPVEGPRVPLAHGGTYEDLTTYTVTEPGTGLTRSFTGSPFRTSTAYWLTGITDRNDNSVTFARRSDGSPTAVSHSGGYLVRLTTENDRVVALAVNTPRGPVDVMTYGYETSGNLGSVVNSSGLPLRFTYDHADRVTSWIDRNGSTFRYVYDGEGRVVETVGPDGHLSSAFAYDTARRTTRYTDSTGATTVYRLNERLQTVAETDPLGNTVSQDWDRYDRLLSRTDTHGRTATWTWDEHGHLTAVTTPGGAVTTAEYDAHGMPVATTAPNGARWTRTYDERGNQLSLVGPDGAEVRFTYDGHGALLSVTDVDGRTETFVPDRAGLPLLQADQAGNTVTFTRDAFGRPVTADAGGAVTTLEWTVEGLPARRTAPDGSTHTWEYDGEGNCLAEVDASGARTLHEYTHFDLPSARTTPDGARHEFGYDTELRLTRVLNAAGRSWSYAYDSVGRVVSESDFDGRTIAYAYDAAGRWSARTNALGQTVTHRFDDDGMLVAKEADGTVTRLTYDVMGRLTSAASPHSTLTVERDDRGRVTAETVDGRTTRFRHDALGRRTGRVTPSGVTTTLTYDADGNRSALDLGGHTLRFTHDPLGREVHRSLGPLDAPLALSTEWDGAGRIREQTLAVPGRVLRSRAYDYRPDDRVRSVTDLLTGQTRTFARDAAGRASRIEAPGWTETYAYDIEGNQTDARWPDRAPHPESRGPRGFEGTALRSAGSTSYVHDAAGRVVERRRKRLSRKPEVWRYTWDAEDRLVSCTTPDGVLWTYLYDAFGRRTAKRRHGPDGTVVERTVFTWDDARLAEQTDSVGATTLTWEHDGHRPLAQLEHRGTVGGEAGGGAEADAGAGDGAEADADAGQSAVDQAEFDSRFFAVVTDLIGTPTELVDETGRIAWRSRATHWGVTSWNQDADAYTPLRFPGQYADPETGLHYNYFRHYDPEAGRYLTPDPLGLDPAPNPAGYIADPLTEADPLGLAPCLQALQDMATKIAHVFPEDKRRYQTVAVIHAITPKGPRTFVAGTSRVPLTKAQMKLAEEMGLIPIPSDEYLPKPPPGERGGHAEQNILHFLNRRNDANGGESWLPTHGAASRPVCPDVCPPIIRAAAGGGRIVALYEPNGTYLKFYWPDNYLRKK
ncbi:MULTISPECIES: DUF6531 domain-containing protein [unclassified Streptomyces]|uniref:DUF6531 domain-containing protein n=1 Tax=unclassified Streptomyces TaxID=2593676 RepID=UPI00070042EC|nr:MULTISPECIES: DUF6531 domain-containing protein [unclassified Streptomyces]KQX51006.1 type IV secretion protein Rhs [Streptomyces sp. Root1304]KRA85172.1 type IV secretion protein Rhs [Streptomyces sp. Root66D1]